MREIIQELKEIKEILVGIQALLLSSKEAPVKEGSRPKQTDQGKSETVSEVFCGYTDDTALQKCLLEFMEFRKKIKAALTVRAARLFLGRLEELAKSKEEKIQIINQSIMNGWKSVYPLSDKTPGKIGVIKQTSFNSYSQRTEDYDAIERRALQRRIEGKEAERC